MAIAQMKSIADMTQMSAYNILVEVAGIPNHAAAALLDRAQHNLINIGRMPLPALERIDGIGPKKALKIKALTDWALLVNRERQPESATIRQPQDLADLVGMTFAYHTQEEFHVASLDSRNKVLGIDMVYRQNINQINVRAAEVFTMPIQRNATSIMLIHSHPSGSPVPSAEDVRTTEWLVGVGEALGIEVLDHLIVCSRTNFTSLKTRGLGFNTMPIPRLKPSFQVERPIAAEATT